MNKPYLRLVAVWLFHSAKENIVQFSTAIVGVLFLLSFLPEDYATTIQSLLALNNLFKFGIALSWSFAAFLAGKKFLNGALNKADGTILSVVYIVTFVAIFMWLSKIILIEQVTCKIPFFCDEQHVLVFISGTWGISHMSYIAILRHHKVAQTQAMQYSKDKDIARERVRLLQIENNFQKITPENLTHKKIKKI